MRCCVPFLFRNWWNLYELYCGYGPLSLRKTLGIPYRANMVLSARMISDNIVEVNLTISRN